MNPKIYPTTEDFRLHLRKAFNEAEYGQEVYIMRYGKRYKLVVEPDAAVTVV